MNKVTTALCCIGILLSLKSYSQKLPPLGTLPTYYNGAFAGEAGSPRINFGTVFRYRGNSSDRNANGYYSSFDAFIPKIRTGIGVSAGYENSNYYAQYYSAAGGTIAEGLTNQKMRFISVSLSPKFSVGGKYTLAPFVDFNYDDNESHSDDILSLRNHNSSKITGRAGLLFNTRKLYVGLTLDVFNKSEKRSPLFIGEKLFDVKSNLQIGYSFQKLPDSKFSVTPQLVIGMTSHGSYVKFSLLDASLMFRYSKFIWGINRNGIGLGYQNKNFKVMVSQIAQNQYYMGSITLRYVFKNNSKSLLNY